MQKIVIILGPTAIGKSSLGVSLAKKFGGEIVSADSVQIYQGLNVGSGKVTEEEMQGIKHHCIDILPPENEFSVFDFVELTKKKIGEISARGKLPIIVGGTGLYVKALVEGFDFGSSKKDESFREELEKFSFDELFVKLQHQAPQMAEKIEKNNKKRVIRALEIAKFGVVPTKKAECDYDVFLICLEMERDALYQRINSRTEKMFENGLIEEVDDLMKKGLDENNQSMRAIGYKEVVDFLKGNCDKQKTISLVCQHARNYAKRQITFFKSLKNKKSYHVDSVEKIEKELEEWL